MDWPRRGHGPGPRGVLPWVLAAFGVASVVQVLAAVAGWVALLMPAVAAVLVVASVVVPIAASRRAVRHRAPVRRRGRPWSGPAPVVEPAPVRVTVLASRPVPGPVLEGRVVSERALPGEPVRRWPA